MANDVVWYDSSETGAPVLNNAAGSLDSVLYACLVTGFRTITLDSVTVTSNVATATYSAGHGFSDKRVLELAGAISGRKLITVTGSGTFTFPAPGVSDGAISGSVTAKRAPLGWSRARNSGNVSIYQRGDVLATGMALRVDDSATGAAAGNYARARMVEAHTGINTFTSPSPPAAQLGGEGVYWTKRNDSAAQQWVLVGDGRTFYLMTLSDSFYPPAYPGLQGVYGFGDLNPLRSGDAFACMVAGSIGTTGANGSLPNYFGSLGGSPTSWAMSLCRGYAGIGGPLQAHPVGLGTSGNLMGSFGPPFPSPVDNGLLVTPGVPVCENNAALGSPIRGTLRGIAAPAANVQNGQLHMQVLDNLVGSDRRWLFVSVGQSSTFGHVAFDITGPW